MAAAAARTLEDVTAAADGTAVRERVDQRLAAFLAAKRPQLTAISPEAAGLLDPIEGFLAGGKRLRPMFLYWGWRAAGAPDGDSVVSAAAALELLQAAALVHDDVMDDSDSRRGRPAMHRQFEQRHRDSGWSGSPVRFGAAAAILAGDLCLSWADELLLASGLPGAALARGKPVYDIMRTELMAGQFLDVLEQARRNDRIDVALNVAQYKSAKYTIERPLHLGAELAGAEPGTIAALRSYGVALGTAFQLRDDLLGVFGDSARTGKPSGDDLREGKRTVLVAAALAELEPGARRRLEDGLGAGPAADVGQLKQLIAGTSAPQQVEKMIAERSAEARDAVAGLDPEVRTVLERLVLAATDRSA